MGGVLRRPSWIALTLLVVVLVITFVELGRWQLRRHDERAALNARVAASLEQPAVPVDELLSVGTAPSLESEWRQVEAVGTYDASRELLVRNRSYDSSLGFGVITPLITTGGRALLVDRGWVPAGETAAEAPTVPPAPAGTVAVTARVRLGAGSDAGAQGLPAGQVRRVAVPDLAADLPYPVYGAYAALVPGQPGGGNGDQPPRPVRPPEPSAGPHLAYALQWFLFAAIAVGGWAILLRGETRTAASPMHRSPAPVGSPRVFR